MFPTSPKMLIACPNEKNHEKRINVSIIHKILHADNFLHQTSKFMNGGALILLRVLITLK